MSGERMLRTMGRIRTCGPSAVTRDCRLRTSASEPLSHSGTAAAAPSVYPQTLGKANEINVFGCSPTGVSAMFQGEGKARCKHANPSDHAPLVLGAAHG